MAESQIDASQQAIELLPPALRRFRHFMEVHLAQVKSELRRRRQDFAETRRNAVMRVSELRSELRSADEDDDTNWIEQELKEAETKLDKIQRAESFLIEHIDAYEREAARTGGALRDSLPRAERFLARKLAALQGIRSITSDAATTEASIARDACDGAIPSLTHEAPSPVIREQLLDLTQAPLPFGFRWMRLSEIELEETLRDVQSAADFRAHASYDTIRVGLQTLRTNILPAVAQAGYSADSFHFMREDRRTGTNYENGLQRVYDAFFGNDAIAVQHNPSTGRFTVLNGRHRLRVATDAGWASVPVRITGRDG